MQKQKEEEERIQIQNQMKKSRGRQSTKKDRKEDVNMEVTDDKEHSPSFCNKNIKTNDNQVLSSSEKKIKKEISVEKSNLA
jgi:hypothetical protein